MPGPACLCARSLLQGSIIQARHIKVAWHAVAICNDRLRQGCWG